MGRKELIVIAIVAGVILLGLGVMALGPSDSPSDDVPGDEPGQVEDVVSFNYVGADQLIIDSERGGSKIPSDGMIFHVVSYTVSNQTSKDMWSYKFSPVLSDGPLTYGSTIWSDDIDVDAGQVERGVLIFEVPVTHGDLTLSLGVGEALDESLGLDPIPWREAGQSYGTIIYMIGFADKYIVVTANVANTSYEGTISTNIYNFEVEYKGVKLSPNGFATVHYITDEDTVYLTPGSNANRTILFDKPVDWNNADDISLVWDGTPKRGMSLYHHIED